MASKAPKQRPSANEIVAARTAISRDKDFVETFQPLEQQEIDQVQDEGLRKVRRDILAGRTNADNAQEQTRSLQASVNRATSSGTSLASGANISEFSDVSIDNSEALSRLNVDADRNSRRINDDERLSVVRTGRGVSRLNSQGLNSLAQSSSLRERAKTNARAQTKSARNKMFGDLVLSAGYRGAKGYSQARKTDVKNEDLDSVGKFFRKRGVGS